MEATVVGGRVRRRAWRAEAPARRPSHGQGPAGSRRLTGHWRGELTTLHVPGPVQDLLRHLRAVPSSGGRLVVLGTPGPIGLSGPSARVAHPLLVVAELLALDDERAAEAAQEVVERHLETAGGS